ncbi:MAG: bifunctional metallophosphatase/5'-nucleotidase [Prevotella sp.]|nr:bifunctional metallophosphatase/5'-nucleotidase [Prevotella sp.]
MKELCRGIFLVTLVLLMVSCRQVVKDTPTSLRQKSIVILYDNDVHCAMDGYAKLAGLRDAIADTADVFLVSNGDYVQGQTVGAISKGQYVVDVMRVMNYDAITLGNHEFDYGMERMFQLLRQVPVPVVCCNLYDIHSGRMVFAPYVMKRVGNKRIAFVGVVTPTSMEDEAYAFRDEHDSLVYDLQREDIPVLVQRAVDEARKAGADYVIVDSHLGEELTARHSDSHTLVANTSGIDIVLDGHSHAVVVSDTILNKEGKPIVVTQTGTKFANIGKLLITPDGRMTTSLIPIERVMEKSPFVAHVVDSIHSMLNEQTGRVICHSEVPLRILDDEGNEIHRVGETTAGDIVADAFRMVTGSDISVLNSGSIRNEVKAGDLTYGDLLSMLPYDNYVIVAEVKGSTIIAMLEKLMSFLPKPDGQFPQVSGMRFTVDEREHRVGDVQILNSNTQHYEPINPARTYTVATTKYCVTDGGLYNTLKGSKITWETKRTYNDIFIEFVTKNLNGHIGQEYAQPQGRIIKK